MPYAAPNVKLTPVFINMIFVYHYAQNAILAIPY